MLYILAITAFIAGFLYPKSRRVLLFQLITLCIIMGGNCGNPDYFNYKYAYENGVNGLISISGTIEIFFPILCRCGKLFGLEFEHFFFISMSAAILLLNHAIGYFTKQKNPVFSLFILYPMAESVIQWKTFWGMVFLIWGIHFLVHNSGTASVIKFCIMVFMATISHLMFAFYILFVLIIFLRKKDILATTIITFAGLCCMLPVLPWLFAKIMNSTTSYFSSFSRLSVAKTCVMIGWQLAGVVLLHFIYKYNCNEDSHDNKYLYKDICNMNILVCMMLPLYIGGTTFMRFYRNLFLMNYILATGAKGKFYKYIFYLYIVATAVFFYGISQRGTSFLRIVRSVFENNVFLN